MTYKTEPLTVSYEALQTFHTELLPLTTVLTLGIAEAVELLNEAGPPYKAHIRNVDDLIHLAKALHSLGSQYVLLRGDERPLAGSLEAPKHDSDKQLIVDVLYDGTDISLIKAAHVRTGTSKGAGYVIACM